MSKKQTSEAVAELAATSPDKAREVAELADAITAAKDGRHVDPPLSAVIDVLSEKRTVVSDTEHDERLGDILRPARAITGIAVCGSHPALIQSAPFDEKDWLIYACSPHNLVFEAQDGSNPGLRYLPGGKRADGGRFRVDQWFELHNPLSDATRPYSYLRELEKLPLVWMRDAEGLARVKGAREYPENELKKRFGPFFFTSSIAYMLYKAIVDAETMGIRHIGIWGVAQASQTEYEYQRPGIQYAIQRATELGIQVITPRESNLFEPQKNVW